MNSVKSKNRYTELNYESPLDCWLSMTSSPDFRGWRNLILYMPWDDKLVTFEGFRPGKIEKRWVRYMIPGELERFKVEVAEKGQGVLRFGNKKDRGHFCLLAGTIESGTLTLFYRSLELTLEMIFDLVMINQIIKETGIKVRRLEIIAKKAFASTRAGRRQYYSKLRKILGVGEWVGKSRGVKK